MPSNSSNKSNKSIINNNFNININENDEAFLKNVLKDFYNKIIQFKKDDINELEYINIILGKYLISFFYYKDIILNKKKFINNVKEITKNKIDDLVEQNSDNKNIKNKQENNIFDWYLKSAKNGNVQAQNN